ncbi:hypothetical protein VTK26DRAFT_917 [Humicola hyalothermophila]
MPPTSGHSTCARASGSVSQTRRLLIPTAVAEEEEERCWPLAGADCTATTPEAPPTNIPPPPPPPRPASSTTWTLACRRSTTRSPTARPCSASYRAAGLPGGSRCCRGARTSGTRSRTLRRGRSGTSRRGPVRDGPPPSRPSPSVAGESTWC